MVAPLTGETAAAPRDGTAPPGPEVAVESVAWQFETGLLTDVMVLEPLFWREASGGYEWQQDLSLGTEFSGPVQGLRYAVHLPCPKHVTAFRLVTYDREGELLAEPVRTVAYRPGVLSWAVSHPSHMYWLNWAGWTLTELAEAPVLQLTYSCWRLEVSPGQWLWSGTEWFRVGAAKQLVSWREGLASLSVTPFVSVPWPLPAHLASEAAEVVPVNLKEVAATLTFLDFGAYVAGLPTVVDDAYVCLPGGAKVNSRRVVRELRVLQPGTAQCLSLSAGTNTVVRVAGRVYGAAMLGTVDLRLWLHHAHGSFYGSSSYLPHEYVAVPLDAEGCFALSLLGYGVLHTGLDALWSIKGVDGPVWLSLELEALTLPLPDTWCHDTSGFWGWSQGTDYEVYWSHRFVCGSRRRGVRTHVPIDDGEGVPCARLCRYPARDPMAYQAGAWLFPPLNPE